MMQGGIARPVGMDNSLEVLRNVYGSRKSQTTSKVPRQPHLARTRIAIGLVFLLVGVLWMAIALGLVPSERSALIAGRAKFCEAIAVYASAYVEHGDLSSFGSALQAIVEHSNGDILSAAVKQDDGTVLIEVGDHVANWNKTSGNSAIDSNIFVPIEVGAKKWGTVEVRFRPNRRNQPAFSDIYVRRR